MKRFGVVLIAFVWLFWFTEPSAQANVVVGPYAENITDEQTYTGQDYDYQAKASRGGYRSSPGTFRGGTPRTGVTSPGSPGTGYSTGPRAPSSSVVGRNPAAPGAGFAAPSTGRWGSFLGGLATGAFIGHLFNPFGGWGVGGYYGGSAHPVVSILFWALLIYLTYRIVKWLFRGKIR